MTDKGHCTCARACTQTQSKRAASGERPQAKVRKKNRKALTNVLQEKMTTQHRSRQSACINPSMQTTQLAHGDATHSSNLQQLHHRAALKSALHQGISREWCRITPHHSTKHHKARGVVGYDWTRPSKNLHGTRSIAAAAPDLQGGWGYVPHHTPHTAVKQYTHVHTVDRLRAAAHQSCQGSS